MNTDRITDVLDDALENAAAAERQNDVGWINRPPVVASRSAVRRFRRRLIVFLQDMPEHATVQELLEELRP